VLVVAYLVGSDIVIDHLAAVPAAQTLLSQLAEGGIGISIITYYEDIPDLKLSDIT
jgi:hypothetical protein